MTNSNEYQTFNVEPSGNTGVRKPYQTPELTVHGRVDEITQSITHHALGSKP
jgi:hypothetical protein